MKKILIDGYFLTKPRGMGRYIKELVYAISTNKQSEDYNIYISITDEEISKELLDVMKNFKIIRRKQVPFPIWEQVYIPYLAKKLNVDILFSPYNTYPLLTKYRKLRNIITIHDLMFLTSKGIGGNWYQKLGNVYRKIIVKSITNKANIITVSKKTREEVQNKLNLKSTVIYTSIDYFFEQNRNKEIKEVFEEDYYYHVGGLSPHKNTNRVIQAFCQLKMSEVKLVVSGLPDENKLKEKYSNYKNIIFTGWIDDAEVARLYKNAKGLIFPSLVEGYGLPIIEAFKYKTNVVTSNIAPMSEIAKSAAILVDPTSIDEIQKGIEQLNNKELCEELIDNMDEALEEINAKVMGDKIIKEIENCFKGDLN